MKSKMKNAFAESNYAQQRLHSDLTKKGALTLAAAAAANDLVFSSTEEQAMAAPLRLLKQRPKHDTVYIEVRGVTNERFNQYHRDDHDTRSKAKYNLLYKHVVSKQWASKKLDADNVDQKVLDALKGDFDRKSHYYIVKINGTRWCEIEPFDGQRGDFYQISLQYLRTTYRFSKMHLLSQRIDTCIKEYAQSPAGMADMLLNRVGKGFAGINKLSEEDALDCCNRLIAFWNDQATCQQTSFSAHVAAADPDVPYVDWRALIWDDYESIVG